MPHLIVEYSANLRDLVDIQKLVDVLHAAALDDGLAALPALRTRAAERTDFRIADGDPSHAFIAILARVGPGREDEAKTRFITRLLDEADAFMAPHKDRITVAFSAEIQEINSAMRINRNHVKAKLANP